MGPRPRHRGAALRTAEVAPLGAAGRRAAASPARAVLGEELGACEEQAPTHVSRLHPAAAAPAAAARAAGADEFVVDAVGGAGHGAPRVVLADAVVVATPGLLLELDGDPDLGGALEEKRHGLQALVLGQGPGHLAMLTRRPLIPDLRRGERLHRLPLAGAQHRGGAEGQRRIGSAVRVLHDRAQVAAGCQAKGAEDRGP
mmetsp:Transcript_26241/g.84648  ORF Transcript_26241/g.84648 Transcript_26241/m.84648 type:complete len:200 (-) Transcript_26241:931-1530(-)